MPPADAFSRSRPTRQAPLLVAALLLSACNEYEWFALAGYEQASFKNDADVVFIIDNSPSMLQEAEALALNFNVFISQLADPAVGGQATEDLSDAVDNYVSFTESRTSVLDYQLGITTTTVTPAEGTTTDLEPGEAGTLVGPIVTRGQTGGYDSFLETLLCDTTNWDVNLLSDDPWDCASEGVPEAISEDYLDCMCGDRWRDNQGGGTEQPLEAALLTLCRSVPEPPEVCYHTYAGTSTDVDDDNTFGDSDVMSIPDMVREDSTVVFVIVTDEGDNSTQFLGTGEDDAAFYLDAYQEFPNTVRFASLGPRYDGENLAASACEQDGDDEIRDEVPYWSVHRLFQAATETGGFYADITQGDDALGSPCEVADFSVYLEQLGNLLVNLVNAFELKSIPDVSSIRVFVNGDEIAPGTRIENTDSYADGWSYDPSLNAVVFWGSDVPDYNARVEIYYRPLEGQPRDLPF